MSIYRFGFRILRTPTGGLASDPSCCCDPCDKFLCEDDGYCCCLECSDKQTPIVQVELNDIVLPTICTPITGPCVGDEPEPHNPPGGYFKATQAMLDATITLVRADCCAWYGTIELPIAAWYGDDDECAEADDQYTTLEVTLRYFPDGSTGGPLRLLSAVLTGTTAVPADVFFRVETRPNRWCEPGFVMSNEITQWGCVYDSARYGPYLYSGGKGGTATVTPCGEGGGI